MRFVIQQHEPNLQLFVHISLVCFRNNIMKSEPGLIQWVSTENLMMNFSDDGPKCGVANDTELIILSIKVKKTASSLAAINGK